LNKLASLKVLTNQLYTIDKEAPSSVDFSAKDAGLATEWIVPVEPDSSAKSLSLQSNSEKDSHNTAVRKILLENIPPNACTLDELQNELDFESKKYVVKTAEMKHRRGKLRSHFSVVIRFILTFDFPFT
jgi:hypothetical protein